MYRFASLTRFPCHVRIRSPLSVSNAPCLHVLTPTLNRVDRAVPIVQIEHNGKRLPYVLLAADVARVAIGIQNGVYISNGELGVFGRVDMKPADVILEIGWGRAGGG